jgi:SpoVK/Ycf46/Vps4 family AAA+-type ATPase
MGDGRFRPEDIKFLPMSIQTYPTMNDVIGRSREFVGDFIKAVNSDKIYSGMGITSDKTFLITGSPGNGKTMAVEALINEMNKGAVDDRMNGRAPRFDIFGFKYSIGKYGTAYINEGSRIVQCFFDTCFTVADNGYRVMAIFDEAENLYGSRVNPHSHKEDSKVLDTIMENMQVLHDTRNIYAVMMSNFPDAFDKASIRSGRVDKRYEFLRPNKNEREFGFQHAIDKVNSKAGYQVIRDYDVSELSVISDGFSYADVVEAVDSAVKLRAKEISEKRNDKRIVKGWIAQKRLVDSVISHGKMFGVGGRVRRIGFV